MRAKTTSKTRTKTATPTPTPTAVLLLPVEADATVGGPVRTKIKQITLKNTIKINTVTISLKPA